MLSMRAKLREKEIHKIIYHKYGTQTTEKLILSQDRRKDFTEKVG